MVDSGASSRKACSMDDIRRTVDISSPDISYANMLLYTSLCIILDRLQNVVRDQETNEHGEVMQEVRAYIDKNYAQDISPCGIILISSTGST